MGKRLQSLPQKNLQRDMKKAEKYYAKAKELEDKEKSNEIICDDDLPFQ